MRCYCHPMQQQPSRLAIHQNTLAIYTSRGMTNQMTLLNMEIMDPLAVPRIWNLQPRETSIRAREIRITITNGLTGSGNHPEKPRSFVTGVFLSPDVRSGVGTSQGPVPGYSIIFKRISRSL